MRYGDDEIRGWHGGASVPERHPVHLAKEIASLDSYSRGRFHFGIGAGIKRREFGWRF